MTEAIRDYLLSIVAVSLLGAVLMALVPKGAVQKTLRFFCGLLLILVTIGPVVQIDFDILSQSMADLEKESGQNTYEMEIENENLVASLIKEKTEAYILDKALQRNMTVEVVAEVQTKGDVPYPCAVSITGAFSKQEQNVISKDIEGNLGIGIDDQEWIYK